jgi:drug/metabolite transporter (DMT)-like permease
MRSIQGYFAAAFCVIVWGGTFVNTSGLLEDFSSLEIMIGRFGLAWVALWILTRKRLVKIKHSDEWLFVGMGVVGASIYQLLENCAIYYTDATNVAILTSVGPIFTAFLVHFFCGEKIRGMRFWMGGILAMLGVLVVSLDGIVNFHIRPVGDLMVVAAMISWSIYSVLVKKANDKGYDHLLVIRRSFFWTLVSLLPLSLLGMTEYGWTLMDGSFSIVLDWEANALRLSDGGNLLSFAFLGLMASAACFVLWNIACKELGVVKSSICIYLIPIVSILTSIIFTGHIPTLLSLLGATCIIVGVAYANYNRRER